MPGVEIHANAFDTVRRGSPLKSSAKAVDGLLVVAFALLFPLLALRWRGPRAFLLGLAVVCLYLVAAQLVFQAGVIVSVTYPLIAAALGGLGTLAVRPLLRSPSD